jgi:hypothetical protein
MIGSPDGDLPISCDTSESNARGASLRPAVVEQPERRMSASVPAMVRILVEELVE